MARSSTTTSSTGPICDVAAQPRGLRTAPKRPRRRDRLFAAAFATLAAAGSHERVSVWPTPRSSSRAARRSSVLSDTTPTASVEAYLEQCTLKTGSLFAAACVLGGGRAEFGRLLGVAFQIVDDVLDCSGETVETGKIRHGHATGRRLSRSSSRRATTTRCGTLSQGRSEGALVRVAATGALERSRQMAPRLR